MPSIWSLGKKAGLIYSKREKRAGGWRISREVSKGKKKKKKKNVQACPGWEARRRARELVTNMKGRRLKKSERRVRHVERCIQMVKETTSQEERREFHLGRERDREDHENGFSPKTRTKRGLEQGTYKEREGRHQEDRKKRGRGHHERWPIVESVKPILSY